MSILYNTEEGKYPEKKKNTENCFYGNGWKAEKINDEYFISYISASHGGGEEKVKITKEIFYSVQAESLCLKEIFKKFKLNQ